MIEDIKDMLADRQSKELFECRYAYMLDGDDTHYINEMRVSQKYNGLPDWAAVGNTCVMWGCGKNTRLYSFMAISIHTTVKACCDSNPDLWGMKLYDMTILQPKNMYEKYGDLPLLITVECETIRNNIFDLAIDIGWKESDIYFLCLEKNINKQYFPDFIKFDVSEYFVDCGVLDGKSTLDFLQLNPSGKVIGFEPSPESYKEALFLLNNLDFKLINKAVYSKQGEVTFTTNGGMDGHRIMKGGNCTVQATTIDEELINENVTYIKMDIEGAELEALKGARNTIIRCRPKLAISIYHKPEDIVEIPQYLMALLPEYDYYIRKYSHACKFELVLYAIPREGRY
ncbi:MAG: FkbM family methyltransferase [Defluviitaleaceae bacterium]|nr:FkbM family methyltransferase [Defluviitaleaceae bacterium]MCL2239566.1 FkbM family methyltransferase [Defluviitaleaceae bacterium]